MKFRVDLKRGFPFPARTLTSAEASKDILRTISGKSAAEICRTSVGTPATLSGKHLSGGAEILN